MDTQKQVISKQILFTWDGFPYRRYFIYHLVNRQDLARGHLFIYKRRQRKYKKENDKKPLTFFFVTEKQIKEKKTNRCWSGRTTTIKFSTPVFFSPRWQNLITGQQHVVFAAKSAKKAPGSAKKINAMFPWYFAQRKDVTIISNCNSKLHFLYK